MAANPHIDGRPTVTERKRSKAEERSYAALLREIEELQRDMELAELEKRNRDRELKERMIPPDWRTVERDVPVRPRKIRVTAAFDAELVEVVPRDGAQLPGADERGAQGLHAGDEVAGDRQPQGHRLEGGRD